MTAVGAISDVPSCRSRAQCGSDLRGHRPRRHLMTRRHFDSFGGTARFALLVALVSLLGCTASVDHSAKERTGKGASADSSTVVSIDWWMPEMFGNDVDSNGVIRLAPAYSAAETGPPPAPVVGNPMRPSAWNVMLIGCQATDAQSYVWDVALPDGNVHIDGGNSCIQWVGFPAQGSYDVTLTMGFADGTTAIGTQLVTVKNYLIVSRSEERRVG